MIRETFVFAGDDGTNFALDTQHLRTWLDSNRRNLQNALRLFPVDAAQVAKIIADNAIIPARVASLNRSERKVPIIVCEFPGSAATEHILVDGRHRFVRAFRDGEGHIIAYLLTYRQWTPFIIGNAPAISQDLLRVLPAGHFPRGRS